MSELTREQARDLHKILRAVHDGVCPKCGATSLMTVHQDFRCTCGFTVHANELAQMEAAVPLALSVAVETFENWRKEK